MKRVRRTRPLGTHIPKQKIIVNFDINELIFRIWDTYHSTIPHTEVSIYKALLNLYSLYEIYNEHINTQIRNILQSIHIPPIITNTNLNLIVRVIASINHNDLNSYKQLATNNPSSSENIALNLQTLPIKKNIHTIMYEYNMTPLSNGLINF